jgi:capsular polysaccharide biosynthesis protein
MLSETKTLKLDYNPILEKASSPTRISISPLKFAAVALLLGFSLSIVIILIKSSLLNRD